MKNSLLLFFLQHLEAVIWILVIVGFAISPIDTESHFTLCPLQLAGFVDCPGCGLGRSMILLLHGRIGDSMDMHPLGMPALIILSWRIVTVIHSAKQYRKMLMSGK